MSNVSDYIHEDFRQWLDTATRGLREKSRERIREEMSGHWDAARADVLDRGGDAHEATTAALVSLGNPREARRRFRHEHFTAFEAFAYLGEDTEAHRKGFMRVQVAGTFIALLIGTIAVRTMLFDSVNARQEIGDTILSLVGGSIGLAIIASISLSFGHLFIRVPQRASDPKRVLHASNPERAIRAWRTTALVFIIIGLVGFAVGVVTLILLLRNSAATVPTWGTFGDAGAVAAGASIYPLLFALFGFWIVRSTARITRLMEHESEPQAHD